MLTIVVPGVESFDQEKQEFISTGETVLQLEHSLAALSKWEAIYETPFLSDKPKSTEETIAYVKCMLLAEDVSDETLSRLSEKNFCDINDYVNRKSTATFFSDSGPKNGSPEIITSELIYYWMSSFGVSFDADQWHLNRLFTVIKIASMKNQKPKKVSASERANQYRQINEQRRAELGTTG